jgi:predicted RNA polymerase sigma factor
MSSGQKWQDRNSPFRNVMAIKRVMDHTTAQAVESAIVNARHAYGRLLALLAARSGDLAGSEDALAAAFAQALETWPDKGTPSNPVAWLMAVAKNRQLDVWRSAAHQTNVPLIEEEIEDMLMTQQDHDAIPDERLKLLFVCAHPAIDSALRAPLMLQTVLGIEADAIATAFLVPTATMAQRLVRVKRKIKDAGIPFQTPSQSDMPERLESVLEAIYGAYSIGWQDWRVSGDDADLNPDESLAEESLYLAHLLAQLLPHEPEVLGLASYVALASSRRPARFDAHGDLVPLDKQDTALWNAERIALGEKLLQTASAMGKLGRFQLEAAIESFHIHRLQLGMADWASLALLYEGLVSLAPSVGAAVARSVAVGQAQGYLQGLAALAQIPEDRRLGFQPAWVAKSHLLELGGQTPAAHEAMDQAIALTKDAKLRAYLITQQRRLANQCIH